MLNMMNVMCGIREEGLYSLLLDIAPSGLGRCAGIFGEGLHPSLTDCVPSGLKFERNANR
jgi:hypothetical protein